MRGDEMSLQTIPLSAVVFDPTTQIRARINQETVKRYAAVMRRASLPEPEVWRDGKRFYIGDGWHRLLAAQRNSPEKGQSLKK
jgi:hypothetical protein